jgi:tRNA G18 (ribose-2'-O)-methylase SpoU
MDMETRNVIDHYHYWKHDAILADLDSKRHNFTVLCSNLYNDFNIATVIRNANAFLAKQVILYGSKQYDRRGTVGTHHYTNFVHTRTFPELKEYIYSLEQQYGHVTVVGIDNVKDSMPINTYDWNKNTHYVLAFGQEQVGLPQEILDICKSTLYIKQYGSVRSLNVGTASGIAMYSYCEYLERD